MKFRTAGHHRQQCRCQPPWFLSGEADILNGEQIIKSVHTCVQCWADKMEMTERKSIKPTLGILQPWQQDVEDAAQEAIRYHTGLANSTVGTQVEGDALEVRKVPQDALLHRQQVEVQAQVLLCGGDASMGKASSGLAAHCGGNLAIRYRLSSKVTPFLWKGKATKFDSGQQIRPCALPSVHSTGLEPTLPMGPSGESFP